MDRLRGCHGLLATVVAADLALLVGVLAQTSSAPALTGAAGVLLAVAGFRLVLVLPDRRVFPCRSMTWVAMFLSVGSVGLWVSTVRADPIDAFLRRAPATDVLMGVALFFLAAICATLVVTTAAGALDARRQELHWEEWA